MQIKDRIHEVYAVLRDSVLKFKKDDPLRLAGTTAYFTIFALAPVIIIITFAIGILLGKERIKEKVFTEIDALLGGQGTEYIQQLVDNFQDMEQSVAGTIIGIAIFVFTSTTFFIVLQNNINYIWRIKSKPSRNIVKALLDRLLSFGIILSMGFILMVSLVIDAVLGFLSDYINDFLPNISVYLMKGADFVLSFGVLMLIFAIIYKFLPDAHIKWKTTWAGAFITTLLFVIGKFLIGWVLGYSDIGIMYGAAGSMVVILLWVFYSSMIFFFGAEITQQYARRYSSSGIQPKAHAVNFTIKEGDE